MLEVSLPKSKSYSNRVLILQAIFKNIIRVDAHTDALDTRLLQKALASHDEVLYLENAGTAVRFLTAYFSFHGITKILKGSERMHQRPILTLVQALRTLGAKIDFLEKEGFLPIRIQASSPTSSSIEIQANISSQFISALCLLAASFEQKFTINLLGEIVSKPYLNLTLEIMRICGIESTFSQNSIEIFPKKMKPIKLFIEHDWSAAITFFSILALKKKGNLLLRDLYLSDLQGDKKVVDLFRYFGVFSEQKKNGLHIYYENNELDLPENLEFNEIPDLALSFIVCATILNRNFKISGLKTLKGKESNRLVAVRDELLKLGFRIQVNDDLGIASFQGETFEKSEPIEINTYEDHRMVFAFAPLMFIGKKISFDKPACVEKSFPNFWQAVEALNF